MDELIVQVATAASVTPEIAGQALAIIFAFIAAEAPAERSAELFAAVPGAEEAAVRGRTLGAGRAARLAGLFGGAGGLMGLAAKLTALGLSVGEMQAIGQALLTALQAQVGPERVKELTADIPGLSHLI